MTNKDRATLWREALSSDDRDVYVSDWSTSLIFEDVDSEEKLLSIAEEVGKIWDAAHMTMREIIQASGFSQARFAHEFTIPKRTVESWCMGDRTPPDYVRYLLIKALDIV